VKQEKKNYFDLSRSNAPNYYFNLNHIMREHSDPTVLFKSNMSKSEMRMIRDDPKYYLQDQKYLNSIKYFSNRTLMDRLKKEEKIVDKMEKTNIKKL
jgi:hypothetical protein